MDDQQLLRYGRQILLPQVDIEGQQALLDATVLIVGLGGLGSPAAMYLAAAGIGRMLLNDFDAVDLSNLQRQIIHRTQDIGRPKAASAADALRQLNPEVCLQPIARRLEGDELLEAVNTSDVVLDCSDNFGTRFAVNKACVETSTPLVSGAVIRFEGQISVFTPGQEDSPCYRCLYADEGELADSCVRNGVIAPLPGILGSLQALEAIKLLLGAGEPLTGRLLLLDALTMTWRTMKLRRNPDCPICGRENGPDS